MPLACVLAKLRVMCACLCIFTRFLVRFLRAKNGLQEDPLMNRQKIPRRLKILPFNSEKVKIGIGICKMFFRGPNVHQVLVAPCHAILDTPYHAILSKEGQQSPKMVRFPFLLLSLTQAHLRDTPSCSISRDNCVIPHKNKLEIFLRYYRYKYHAV